MALQLFRSCLRFKPKTQQELTEKRKKKKRKISRLMWYSKIFPKSTWNIPSCPLFHPDSQSRSDALYFFPAAAVDDYPLNSRRHLCRLNILFLPELLSAVLRPMRSRAFSSSSCCCRLLSAFPSDAFPLKSEPEAGFRRSFSFIIWAARSKKDKFKNIKDLPVL